MIVHGSYKHMDFYLKFQSQVQSRCDYWGQADKAIQLKFWSSPLFYNVLYIANLNIKQDSDA